jgi:hypothetical protein
MFQCLKISVRNCPSTIYREGILHMTCLILHLKEEVLRRTNCILSFDMTRTAQESTPTILPCGGKVFTELLPNDDKWMNRQIHAFNSFVTVAYILFRSRKPKSTAVGIRFADHATPSVR